MNTFRAKLLPCAGTAGGASPQARAAGQPIAICGDLSGREARRGTYASRPVRRDEPHPDFQSAGHGFCRAIFAPIAFARARGRLGDGLATRGCGALNSGQPAPISFLGSARFQACFKALRGRVDVITAGFPCQDISFAGKRAGLNGERSRLWKEAMRAVREIGPCYIILENSVGLLGAGLGEILREMASLGYDAVWHCIPAAYVGARHNRDRIWIVGYLPDTESARFIECWRQQCEEISLEERRIRHGFAEPGPSRVADGIANRTHRNRAIGNSVTPVIPELIGRAILQSMEEAA